MAYINEEGYLERKTHGGKRNPHGKSTVRNWWLIKEGGSGKAESINMRFISFPRKYIGKKIRFKVEFIEG